MFQFSNLKIYIANENDISSITALLNAAYRGDSSRKGWTTEADLIDGEIRTSEAIVKETMQKEGSIFLKYVDEGSIIACVNLQKHFSKLYFGMFSVQPNLQGRGVGKKILIAAEEYAKHVDCFQIYMTVISIRKELIDWYIRHGYIDIGKRIPFKEDEASGKHKIQLEFLVLEKQLLF